MKFTYSIYKVVKVDGGSDIDGKYFIVGNMDYVIASDIAENLSIIDTQMTELIMTDDLHIKYIVVKEQTGKTEKTFKVM